MNKKTIRDLDLKNKRLVMRVDFNVPIAHGRVEDDTRITAALPAIGYALDHGASVVLMSHLGRPQGEAKPEYSLKPVADYLAACIDVPVRFVADCVGPEVKQAAESLRPGEILLLENLRFHPEEEGKADLSAATTDDEKSAAQADMKRRQDAFAAQLASLGQVYVNDAFGSAHRAHASVSVITRHIDDSVAGFLLEKEIQYLGQALADPERPFVGIIGGAKISGKIDVITRLLRKVDALLIGGGMAYTFFKARGWTIGNSIVEDDKLELAKEILAWAETNNVQLLLPVDTVIADRFSEDARHNVVASSAIEEGLEGVDIGPETRALFAAKIKQAKTVVWNGPMGCFEMKPFAAGTLAVARAVAETDCVSIIGGGDSVSAVKQAGLADQMTHISTGGGASLEFLEGKALPGVVALDEKEG